MSSHLKAIVFAAALSIVCGSLLTLASTGLKTYQLKNIALDRQKNILKSVGLFDAEKPPAPDMVEKLYADNIKLMRVDPEGKIVSGGQHSENDLKVYLYLKQKNIEAYIIPVDSRGLWGKIQGYLAMKNDGTTISGFTVFSHSETPGLGGEIAKKWFQKNFVGKKILDDQGKFVSVTIAKGKVKDRVPSKDQENYVDGISGASMTGKFLSEGLQQILARYEPLSERFRRSEIKSLTTDN